ncbi:MAG: hypothetical protein LWX83_00410 [Anaerolineae bacterium]|nr:hypothetical protein [Anaerolineae bacterium]
MSNSGGQTISQTGKQHKPLIKSGKNTKNAAINKSTIKALIKYFENKA